MSTVGIYKITNLLNNKSYIGQSIHVEERLNRHRQCPKENSHYPLYRDMKIYGLENFKFELLEECSINQLNEREIYWIAFYDTYFNGYNQTKGGSAGGHYVKISEEALVEIIDLLQHSSLTQTKIATMFNVGVDTISEINHGKSRYNENLTYPLRKNKHDANFCIDCGQPILFTSTRCISCANKQKALACRKNYNPTIANPDRDQLKKLIRTTPFIKIGEMYGVSDNAIRKWCDKLNLPRKVSDIKKYSDEEWALL